MERDTRDGKETMEDPGNVEGDRGSPKYPGSDAGHRWSAYRSFKSLYLGYRVVWSAPLWTVLGLAIPEASSDLPSSAPGTLCVAPSFRKSVPKL